MELKEGFGLPFVDSEVFRTAKGTPYLKEPGVIMWSEPHVNLANMRGFFAGFDSSLGFSDYLNDPTPLSAGEQICKAAGQVCYASFGPKRTKNAEAEKYFDNIKSSGHGSVLEHANYVIFVYGVSRSFSHEAVRHRAGFGYSQLSQRYIDGRVLRFVEKKSFQEDAELHKQFIESIDRAAEEYERATERLLELQQRGLGILSAEAKTDLRKKVRQDAREFLPNSTETWIVITGNARAWRHFCEMRANEHAETQIREVAYRVYICLNRVAPILFGDYRKKTLGDGTNAVETNYRKV